jgi:hypothetical protein
MCTKEDGELGEEEIKRDRERTNTKKKGNYY